MIDRTVNKNIILFSVFLCINLASGQEILASDNIITSTDKDLIDLNNFSISNKEAYLFLGLAIAGGSLYIINSQGSEISKRKADMFTQPFKTQDDEDAYEAHMNSYYKAKGISTASVTFALGALGYGYISGAFSDAHKYPRMNRVYDYPGNKLETLEICKNILQQLEYEIDIYAPESFMLTTRPTQHRRVLRIYDYIIYLKISDRIDIHIAAERNIFNRGSESTAGGNSVVIKQTETYLPTSIQKKIFDPIYNNLALMGFKQQLNK